MEDTSDCISKLQLFLTVLEKGVVVMVMPLLVCAVGTLLKS